MPRAGWLAAGGATAAIGAPLLALGGPAVAAAIAAMLGLAALALSRAQRSGVLIASMACAVGAAAVVGRICLALLLTPSTPVGPPPHDDRTWGAEVLSVGSTAEGQQRAMLTVHDQSGSAWRVYAWLPRYPSVVPTDRLRFSGRLEPAPTDEGFGAFLARSGAVATIRVRSLERLAAEGALAGLETLRRRAGEALARALPAPQAGLAAGILVGLRDQVDRELAADFATAGLSHVVAISGWNIALVGALVMAILRGRPRRQRAFLVIGAIVLYTLLAGASPSVVRAAIMGAICLMARESGRRGAAATALGLAAWTMLLLDPAVVTDIGFQLSVAATAGLLAWSEPLSDRVRAIAPTRTPGWLTESLGVSLAAQAATLPLVLLHFGRLSVMSPVANLLMAPLVAPAMLAALCGLAAGAVVSVGAPALFVAPVVLASSLVLGAMVALGGLAASVPLASLDLAAPLALVTASLSALFLWLAGTGYGRAVCGALRRRVASSAGRPRAVARAPSAPLRPDRAATLRGERTATQRSSRAVIVALGVGGALIVVAAALAGARPDGRLRLTVLDVGQGDAVLLEGARGGRILVDGGPDPDRLAVLLDERLPAYDRRLDLVILTHPHEDHVAGLALLLERYRVDLVAEPGMIGVGPGDAAFRAVTARQGTRRVVLAAPDTLQLDGAQISVLWPRRGEVPSVAPDGGTGINNVSIVLDVRMGERRLLLTGDAEEEVDPELLAGGLTGSDPVDVLKVAHHGSRTATTDPFLDVVRPRVALVSSGRDNPYGHPAPETIDRIRQTGARVLRTDLDGSLEVSTDGRDLRIATTGGRAAAVGRVAQARLAFGAPGSLCALPVSPAAPVGRGQRAVRASGTQTVHAARGRPAERDPGAMTPSRALLQPVAVAPPPQSDLPCYDRSDGHPVARRGGRPARQLRARATFSATCLERRRDRGLHRTSHRGGRRRCGPPIGGGGGPPP